MSEAGRDKCILDGDSLLMAALSSTNYNSADSNWISVNNIQTLALLYDIEEFLAGLVSNNINFTIFFLKSNNRLWKQPFALLREVLIRHLQFTLKEPLQQSVSVLSDRNKLSEFVKETRATYILLRFVWEMKAETVVASAALPFDTELMVEITKIASICFNFNLPVVDLCDRNGIELNPGSLTL